MLYGKALIDEVERVLEGDKVVFAQLAPAVRVSIGEEFGLPPGTELTYKTIGLLKELGFDEVVDTPFGADLVTYAEAREFIINNVRPLFNSCCVGWREFCKKHYPHLINNISSVISPMMATGGVIKTYVADAMGLTADDIVVVGIMPCTMKKLETKYTSVFGWRYVDYVITTRELGEWAKAKSIDIKDIKGGQFSEYLPVSSKGGTIFGVTGGLSEAFITTIAEMVGGVVDDKVFRDNKGIREIDVNIGDLTINIGIAHGVNNIKVILDDYKKYDFVEMMFCPYGCIGGPGQPLPQTDDVLKARALSLRRFSSNKAIKTPIDNMYIKSVVDYFNEKNVDLMKFITHWGST